MIEIFLASASPRRRELLEQVGISCKVVSSLVEERVKTSVPEDVVRELAREKCEDVATRLCDDGIFLGADTVVAVHGKILGKPADEVQASRILEELQGETHQVYTGVTLIWKSNERVLWEDTFFEKTDVSFYPMTEEEIWDYVHTGEPMDKAGAYGIQGKSAAFVREIRGDYNNVVGLPVAAVYQRLKHTPEAVVIRMEKRTETVRSRYRIRNVRETDLKAVAQIEAECFPEAEAACYQEFVERYYSCRKSFFVVETEDGKLVGFCNGCSTNSDELTDDLYHDTRKHDEDGEYQMIFGLDMLPAYQGQGIGQALMCHMILKARERGKKAVILTCKESMISFYESLGYKYQYKTGSRHGGAVWHKMIYKMS